MKRCPHCNSTYTDDSLWYCLQDGTPLIKADAAYAETLIDPEIPKPEEKVVKRNLSLVVSIVGVIAALIAYLLNTHERFIYNIIFLTTIFVAILAILVRSYFDTNRDQNILYTFITDNLLSNKTKRALEAKTEIAIIEDKESQSIYDNYKGEFKKVEGVSLTHVICDSSDEETQISSLIAKLKGVEAVIVVRTRELEEKPWVYDALEEWAFQNSHAPCLVIDKISPEEARGLNLSPIPNKYFFITDDKTSLPWRLLQRANERAFAWRHQASFNRLTAMSIFILLLAGFMTNYFASSLQRNEYEAAIQNQRNEDYKLLQKTYQGIARQTREQFVASFLNGIKDDTLNVSYWFKYNGTFYQLSTTETAPLRRTFTESEPSVIGCGFFNPNHIVQWNHIKNSNNQPELWDVNELQDAPAATTEKICWFSPEKFRSMKSLFCNTFNRSGDLETTVGICIFTESEGNIFSKESRDFLRRKTQEFHDFVFESLKNKKLVPQPE